MVVGHERTYFAGLGQELHARVTAFSCIPVTEFTLSTSFIPDRSSDQRNATSDDGTPGGNDGHIDRDVSHDSIVTATVSPTESPKEFGVDYF
jgi:hypothetical protein